MRTTTLFGFTLALASAFGAQSGSALAQLGRECARDALSRPAPCQGS